MSKQEYLFELDGKPAGRFFSFSGGSAQTEVITTMDSGNGRQQKHIGNVRYQDIVMKCGTGMSQKFYSWVGSSFDAAAERLDGAIVKLDQNQNAAGRLEFRDALVTQLTTPDLKSGANDEAFLLVSISPEFTRSKPVSGKADLGVYVSDQSAKWNVGGFRLSMGGLDNALSHVTKISSLTLGINVAEERVSSNARRQIRTASTSFPNIKFSLPEMHAEPFFTWFEDFVVNGNNSDSYEKDGSIEFFGPTAGKAFFTLECKNMGITALDTETQLRTKSMAPVRVTLYAERMKFSAGTAAIK